VKPNRKLASLAEFSLASLVSLSPLSLLAESDPNQATPSDLAPVDGDTSSDTTDLTITADTGPNIDNIPPPSDTSD